MLAEFRKVHMRAFCYSIRDMNYRQMRAYALYGIQPLLDEPVSSRMRVKCDFSKVLVNNKMGVISPLVHINLL